MHRYQFWHRAFQSTHPCGVRRRLANCGATRWKFQSTHPCGVRLWLIGVKTTEIWFQSTHPCGVRRVMAIMRCLSRCFNPRTRVGCDKSEGFHLLDTVFQSTHPCGVRPVSAITNISSKCFNPRTRVGCDCLNPQGQRLVFDVSIHAPVWGATKPMIDDGKGNMFQSTHPCGVRR